MAEALTINGVSLASYAFMTSDISGLMTVPERRGENVVVPQRHGRIRQLGTRFDANEIVLPLWIVGADPDTGALPTLPEELDIFFERRDQLLKLLYADPLLLQYTRPNGHTVQAYGEVVDVLDFTRRHAEPLAQVSVAIEITNAFWEDADSVSQEITGPTETTVELTEFAGATAPMSDLVITVFGPCNNPMFTHGPQWVRFNGVIDAGRQLQIDIGRWLVGPGTGSPWLPSVGQVEQGRPGPWLELDPSVQPFEITFTHTTGGSATATISGRRKYLSP
jgi:hypothetical protein